jgi:hypothetical protein
MASMISKRTKLNCNYSISYLDLDAAYLRRVNGIHPYNGIDLPYLTH